MFNAQHFGVISKEIEKERRFQIEAGYDRQHDDSHSNAELIGHVKQYVDKADISAHQSSPQECRKHLIQVAALAVATIEKIDRAANPKSGVCKNG